MLSKKAIWKYVIDREVPIVDGARRKIEMPVGAIVRHVDMQHEALCLWAEVDTEAPLEERTFTALGTGHWILPEDLIYVGTCQFEFIPFDMRNVPNAKTAFFVWHVYELIEESKDGFGKD